MKILVTGGAGFIGSHVADACVRDGHEVVVVDDLSSGKKENVNPACRFLKADVSSPEFFDIVARERPAIIDHHAAQIDVRVSVADPAFDARVNIMGMINVCRAAVAAGSAKVIFASSGGVLYGEAGARPSTEEAPVAPTSPYGVSKCASEMYLKCFNLLHGLDYTCLRYANVYGPRQKSGEAGVVAIFAKAMLSGNPTVIFGDGKQERDFVYVGDVVRANILALSKGGGASFNIGSGRATSVVELHRMMAEAAGFSGEPQMMPERAGELRRSVLAADKAAGILGWRPTIDIRDGLAETWRWFSAVERD